MASAKLIGGHTGLALECIDARRLSKTWRSIRRLPPCGVVARVLVTGHLRRTPVFGVLKCCKRLSNPLGKRLIQQPRTLADEPQADAPDPFW
jgi:hypothetical protein